MKLSILQKYDLKTATYLLAGAAYDFDHPYNGTLEYLVPDEEKIRPEIIRCARQTLSLSEDANDDASVAKIPDLLNDELEQMMLAEERIQSC
jgi:hypothetical protein